MTNHLPLDGYHSSLHVSVYLGTYRCANGRQWAALIYGENKRLRHLGTFNQIEDAAKAFDKGKIEHGKKRS